MTARTSVILPSFNRAHLLDRAITSVLTQTDPDLELLVVDDCSTDGTEGLVSGYDDDRIVYLKSPERRGAAAARNLGIDRASGEFIGFIDSDDEWLADKLERQVAVFERADPRVGVVYGAIVQEGASETHDELPPSGDLLEKLLVGNFIGPGQVLIRGDCLRTVGAFDQDLPSAHDWDLWIRIAERYEFQYSDCVVCVYHLQPDSISVNRAAKVEGYRRLAAKHRGKIAQLPRALQCAHHYYVARNLWGVGARTRCFVQILRAAVCSPTESARLLAQPLGRWMRPDRKRRVPGSRE